MPDPSHSPPAHVPIQEETDEADHGQSKAAQPPSEPPPTAPPPAAGHQMLQGCMPEEWDDDLEAFASLPDALSAIIATGTSCPRDIGGSAAAAGEGLWIGVFANVCKCVHAYSGRHCRVACHKHGCGCCHTAWCPGCNRGACHSYARSSNVTKGHTSPHAAMRIIKLLLH